MTHFQMKSFLSNHGIEKGYSYTFGFEKYKEIVSEAKDLDEDFGMMMMDCFDPIGETVAPGCSSKYYFDASVWEDLFGFDFT